MYRLAFYDGDERIELNFLPSEADTALQMSREAADKYGQATLMHYDEYSICVLGKFFAKRNVSAVA
jgi:hypothetical protein